MPTAPAQVEACPFHAAGDSKSRRAAGPGSVPDAQPVTSYAGARDVLRRPEMRQAGFKAELVHRRGNPTRPPVLYLHGPAHRRQRAAAARFFAPKVVDEKHRPFIAEDADRLIGDLRRSGRATLDTLALDLAVSVAAQIVGLTESDKAGMIRRIDGFLSIGSSGRTDAGHRALTAILGQLRMLHFHWRDVRPAIKARRAAPREDVISHLIGDGYRDLDILVECVTYGAAGMVTTREFITMAGWHLLENDALRRDFLETDRAGRIAILEEILRLEPVVGILYRKENGAGTPIALDIRAANTDAAAMGECPFQLRTDRTRGERVPGAGLAFGDGEHRCPGAGVALAEAEVFLDRLLRVPGLRLERAPNISWNPLVTGYELRGCELVVDRAAATG